MIVEARLIGQARIIGGARIIVCRGQNEWTGNNK